MCGGAGVVGNDTSPFLYLNSHSLVLVCRQFGPQRFCGLKNSLARYRITSQYRSDAKMSLNRVSVMLPMWKALYFSLNRKPHGAISPLPDICVMNGGPKQRE